MLSHCRQRVGYHPPRFPHDLDLGRALMFDHHNLRTLATSLRPVLIYRTILPCTDAPSTTGHHLPGAQSARTRVRASGLRPVHPPYLIDALDTDGKMAPFPSQ